MFERFSNRARRVVGLAREEARRLGHSHVGTEHLLLGILLDGESRAARTLAVAGVSLETVREKTVEAVGRAGGEEPAGAGATKGDVALTSRAKRALDRAGRFSLQRKDAYVETEHILLGVLDVEGTAGQVLRRLGVDVPRLRESLDRTQVERPAVAPPEQPSDEGSSPRCPSCGAALDATLSQRVLSAGLTTGAGEAAGSFVVPYCSACGSALGASPL